MKQLQQSRFPLDIVEQNVMGFVNSRKILGDTSELKQSIKQNGVLDPPIVHLRKDAEGDDRVILIAGHRRVACVKELRQEHTEAEGNPGPWGEITCTVYEGDLPGAYVINLVENLHHKTLSYADKIEAVAKRNAVVGNQTRTAELLGISQSLVSILCAMHRGLCREGLEALRLRQITRAQATKLSKVTLSCGSPNRTRQLEILEELLGDSADAEIPDDVTLNKRPRTYRRKSDVEAMRARVATEDLGLNEEYKDYLMHFFRWFFTEVDDDDLVYPPIDLAAEPVQQEDPALYVKKRRRADA